ncbi:MAG: metal ABC transporter permease [Dehalococcoidia bacterium]
MPDISFSEPLQYEFFKNALLAATMAGGLCGLVGVYVVLRRMSYIGHGLSHAIFGGAVVSFVASINFYIGAGLWGFASALLINLATRKRQISADVAIGVVTTASFALGVAIISRASRFSRNFEAALFGNVLGVTSTDIYILIGVAVGVALLIAVLYKQLLFMTFDAEVAPAYGVRSGWVDTAFALILAAVVVATMRILGVTLIAATLVVPPITGRLLTNSFSRMMVISTVLGAVTGFMGIYISYWWDVASGAAIVLLQASVFLVVIAYTLVRARLAGQSSDAGIRLGSEAPAFD